MSLRMMPLWILPGTSTLPPYPNPTLHTWCSPLPPTLPRSPSLQSTTPWRDRCTPPAPPHRSTGLPGEADWLDVHCIGPLKSLSMIIWYWFLIALSKIYFAHILYNSSVYTHTAGLSKEWVLSPLMAHLIPEARHMTVLMELSHDQASSASCHQDTRSSRMMTPTSQWIVASTSRHVYVRVCGMHGSRGVSWLSLHSRPWGVCVYLIIRNYVTCTIEPYYIVLTQFNTDTYISIYIGTYIQ